MRAVFVGIVGPPLALALNDMDLAFHAIPLPSVVLSFQPFIGFSFT